MDNKAGASVIVANMVSMKRAKFVPQRDVIMVLTCDEESTAVPGTVWLLTHVPRLSQAAYALNTDAGGVYKSEAGRDVFDIQAAEKTYITFELTATNDGGHSSVPRRDNAIYALAAGLSRLASFSFPVEYNAVSQASYARGAEVDKGQLAEEYWPGSLVIPGMSNGATDGLYLRNVGVPVFGTAALAVQPDDDRSHGLNERVPVVSLYRVRTFWDKMVRELAAAAGAPVPIPDQPYTTHLPYI